MGLYRQAGRGIPKAHLGQADDSVQRGTQLMTHARQKAGLGTRAGLGQPQGLHQLLRALIDPSLQCGIGG